MSILIMKEKNYRTAFRAVTSYITILTGNNQEEASDWGDIFKAVVEFVDSYDYLRVESPKFVLQGKSFRARGNLFIRRFLLRKIS